MDTNVLLRTVNPHDARHPVVDQAITTLLAQGDEIYLTPQVLVEFWGVATRPISVNGFGWQPAFVAGEVQRLLSQFPLLEDNPSIFPHWVQIVSLRGVQGKQVHDARLIAVMQVYNIQHLLTFNGNDFRGYSGIIPVDPASVI